MAKINFTYNYRIAGNQYRYYPGGESSGTYDVGVSAGMVNHLNLTRRDIILRMSNLRRESEGKVRARSRVDTGNMRSKVTGTGDFGTNTLKISFGWEPFAPYYAPFQEFGTRRGITPMRAVLSTFLESQQKLRAIVTGSSR